MQVEFHVDEFLSDLRKLEDDIDVAIYREWIRQSMEAVAWMRNKGYQNRTGKLTASMFQLSTHLGSYSYRSDVGATAPYARWVDEGSRPHIIRARRGGMLRFYWPKAGRWITTAQVHHPGFGGAHFITQTALEFAERFPAAIQTAIDSVIGRQ